MELEYNQLEKFNHNGTSDWTPYKDVFSSLVSCHLGLISCVQCLHHLLPAQPLLLWGEIPTQNAENGDRTKDNASLQIIDS